MKTNDQTLRSEEDLELVTALTSGTIHSKDTEVKTLIDKRYKELRNKYKDLNEEEFREKMVDLIGGGSTGVRLKAKLNLIFFILIAVVLLFAIVYHPENSVPMQFGG